MLASSSKRVQTAVAHALAIVGSFAMLTAARADELGESTAKTIPARTTVLVRSSADKSVRAFAVDWSGYRGIRRYSPYYAPGYSIYPPYYYGHYAYRPWYARPYAYAYGYPAYAPPLYRYAPYGYGGYMSGYLPYAWGGLYPPPIAAPLPAVAAPQVFSTVPAADADYVGCFYW